MKRMLALCAMFLLAQTVVACNDSGVTFNPEEVTVETKVDRNILNAGATFVVTCIVTDLDGREIDTDTAFTVEPGKAVQVSGRNVTPANPGEYVVTCMLPDGNRPDETPETVLVTMKNITSVETTLSATQVNAGSDVQVTCKVLNADGEQVDWDTLVEVAPAEKLVVTDHVIEADAMGEYAVACRAKDLPIVDETPETLTVVAGEPAQVRATIKEDTVTAGTEVVVFCSVEDTYDNVLEYAAVVDPQTGFIIDGTTITPQIAGEYDVTCSAVEAGLAGLEKIPDHLIVTAGPLASVLLKAKPKKEAYKIGDKVEVTVHGADAFGNELEGYTGTVTAPEGISESGGKFKFTAEGAFTFTGKLDPPNDSLTGELTLICDESGPDIVVFTPERGVTLDGDPMVSVEGNVIDAQSPTVELEINGASVPVDSDGNFHHVVEGAHGLNLLTLIAYDGFGNRAKIVQSFYYSTDYSDFASGNIDDVLLEQSLIVYLGQNFLDDGEHDKQHIDDLATLVEILLDGLDMSLLGGDLPIVDTIIPGLVNLDLANIGGFNFKLLGDLVLTVYIQDVSFAEPHVTMNTRDGGIDMTIAFDGTPDNPGVYVQLYVEVGFLITVQSNLGGKELFSAGIQPGLAVQSSAGIETLLVETSFDIDKNVGEELNIKVADLSIAPAGIHIEPLQDLKIALGDVVFSGQKIYELPEVELGQLVQGLNDVLSDYIVDPLLNFVIPGALDLLEPLIEDQVTNLLADLLNQFELSIPIPLPQLPGAEKPVEITFKTLLSSVHFKQDGGELGLGAGFMAPKGVDREVLGSIMRAGCGGGAFGVPTFDSAEKVEIAAMLDMVNELLFALWWGGGLTLNLDESVLGNIDIGQFGLTDLAVATNFWLPPILDDCTAKGMVEVQLGDLLVTPSFKLMGAPLTISMFVSAALDAKIYGDGNNIGLDILGMTEIGTQIVEVQGDLGALAGMFDIEDLVENILVPMIVEQVSNLSLGSFPLPEIDLSTLIPGIPAGTKLSLGNLVIEMQKGYLVFGGELL